MEMKLELVTVPVTDVDRAKAFYVDQVGFHDDYDHRASDQLRFVQLTPPGSACSIVLGGPQAGIGDMEPGSQRGLQVVVADVEKTRELLVGNGVECTEIDDMPWGKFTFFADPDGNAWSVQELPLR